MVPVSQKVNVGDRKRESSYSPQLTVVVSKVCTQFCSLKTQQCVHGMYTTFCQQSHNAMLHTVQIESSRGDALNTKWCCRIITRSLMRLNLRFTIELQYPVCSSQRFSKRASSQLLVTWMNDWLWNNPPQRESFKSRQQKCFVIIADLTLHHYVIENSSLINVSGPGL